MRMMTHADDDPSDVIKKINDFIDDNDNTTTIIDKIGIITKALDDTEQTVNNIGDKGYKNEMLGYITMARTQTMNLLDALDSMLEI